MPLGNVIDIVGSIYAPEKDEKTHKPINHKKLQDVFNELDSVINNDVALKSDIPSSTEEQRYYDSNDDLIARDVYLETTSYSGNTITGIFRQQNTGTNDSPVWETRYVFDQNDAGALHLNANTPGIVFPDGSQISSEDFNSSGQVTHADNADNATQADNSDAYAGLVASNQNDEEIPVFTGSGVESKGLSDVGGGRKQVFTSDGTFPVPSNVTELIITAVGGGGGGGAGGARINEKIQVTAGNDINVTVGSGGTGGSDGDGGDGTKSEIGSLTVTGGIGGRNGEYLAGGSGAAGNPSGASKKGNQGNSDAGGDGGDSIQGIGGSGSINSAGGDGTGYGSGGAGGATNFNDGGDGADGIVIVQW